jgi:hypothetical protein
MYSAADEVILAQEQGAIMRESGVKKELEGEFGFGELQGTLVLTNRRLIFVSTDLKEIAIRIGYRAGAATFHLVYSDVDDLSAIPEDPSRNLFIAIDSISSARGHREEITRPRLEVKWWEGSEEKGRVFTEVLTGRSRKKNLNDWAAVILKLKSGTQKLISLPKVPGVETLEGKLMRVLADMQEKGVFDIEEEVEETFSLKLDSDEVQAACEKLSTAGLLTRRPAGGDVFYRRRSPLGEDDLSS